jgi:hypothetical protein
LLWRELAYSRCAGEYHEATLRESKAQKRPALPSPADVLCCVLRSRPFPLWDRLRYANN